MSAPIVPPTPFDVLTGNLIQSEWRYSLQACYRPSADFEFSSICAAYPSLYSTPEGNLTQESVENDTADSFKTYSPCCPDTEYYNKTNIYTLTQQCPYIACFTSNKTLVSNFGQCIEDHAVIAEGRMKNNGTMRANATRRGFGQCEFIDFKELKKGVKSGAQHRAVLSVQGILVLVFATLLACDGSI